MHSCGDVPMGKVTVKFGVPRVLSVSYIMEGMFCEYYFMVHFTGGNLSHD